MSRAVVDQIQIRSWQVSDLASAIVLNRTATEHISMTSETGDWARDMEGIETTFARSGGEFLVGHLDEELVVMGGFKLLSETRAEIKRMRVAPSLQGKGIGYWFVDLLETRMLLAGITDVDVSTTSKQEGAIRLYTGAGYEETGRTEIERGHDKGLIIVSFVKHLVDKA